MTDEWGPWIEHGGDDAPELYGFFVHAVDNGGDEYFEFGDEIDWDWMTCHPEGCIMRYRIMCPPTILQDIAREPEKVDA